MKYCLRYTNICTKLNKADEITIKYIEDKGLVAFLEKFSSQRVNLLIDPSNFTQSEVRKLVAIKKQYPDYRFAAALLEYDDTLINIFQQEEIPFYIHTPCVSWESFNFLIKAGVCDINLSGPLAFEMSKVKRVLESLNRKVQIRVTPNAVYNIEKFTPSLIGFFIRPEDVDLYEDFVDILDFQGLEHQDTFFSIYAEQKMFIGNLNQCIYGIQEQVDNKGLITEFGNRRRDCGRQCLNGGRCKRCYILADLAKPMGERAREKILETLRKEQERLKNEEESVSSNLHV